MKQRTKSNKTCPITVTVVNERDWEQIKRYDGLTITNSAVVKLPITERNEESTTGDAFSTVIVITVLRIGNSATILSTNYALAYLPQRCRRVRSFGKIIIGAYVRFFFFFNQNKYFETKTLSKTRRAAGEPF